MPAVTTTDGIKYGFRLMIYFIFALLIALVMLAAGIGLMISGVSDPLGGINFGSVLSGFGLSVGGFLIFYAGVLGSLYKMIADAVKVGNESI